MNLEVSEANRSPYILGKARRDNTKSPYLEIDVTDYLSPSEGESLTNFNENENMILSTYRHFLNFVEQDKTFTNYVAPLPAMANYSEAALWYITYPFKRERPILKYLWVALGTFLCCLIIHGWSTRVAYFLHVPGSRLRDLGFDLLPELDPKYKFLSEVFFNFIFIGTILMIALHPQRFRLFTRLLFMFSFLYLCRCASFLSTGLPSPAAHCQKGHEFYDPPKDISEILLKFSTTMGCGDLIFSGHSLHSTTAVLMFTSYVRSFTARVLWWFCLITMYLLIIAARKHYTIDVLVAIYFIPFVFTVYTDRVEPWLFKDVKKRKPKDKKIDRLMERQSSASMVV
eukprot:TRINITY_DN13916_c0_g1_i1.p1 TRINITY_DN13916_c0_g1~~TRINITY_DN13916_c0_g1_i1.p1  ORF type:complete len:342 (-),score=81.55 TRINITY_DN13916_c0_g1_i1:110-1135(-)